MPAGFAGADTGGPLSSHRLSPDSASVTEMILSDDGLFQQVKASIPTGGNPLRYVHLQVTRP